MIANFLHPARSLGDWAADILRGIGLLGLVFAAVFFELTGAGIIAFALPGLFLPRFLGLRAWADIACSSILLVAAASNIFNLYTRISWWDLVVHFACTGVLAAGCYLLCSNVRVVPAPWGPGCTPRIAIVLTTTFGLALSALWEMVEWFGFEYFTNDIVIYYVDTIGDMALGGLGALGAGFVVAYLPLIRATSAIPAAVRPSR